MEAAIALGSLKVAYHVLISGIRIDQVPDAVRRCIQFVRTCHRDLEDLIRLRNESLALLEARPAILARVNDIIDNAHRSLLEVARLVEKLRPEARGGATPLRERLEWLFIDQKEFTSLEPLISRQHAAVISELNFLRQLVLLVPLIQNEGRAAGGGSSDSGVRNAVAWENVALLDEMMGGSRGQRTSSVPVALGAQSSTPNVSLGHGVSTGLASSLHDSPPPYRSPDSTTVPHPARRMIQPLVYNAVVPPQRDMQADVFRGIQEKRSTTFESGGIALLFGDVKSSFEQPTPQTWQQNRCQQPSSPQLPLSPRQPPSATPIFPGAALTNINAPEPWQQQSQQSHYPPAPPSFTLSQQRLSVDLAIAKPLSTIPQELIHRYDTYETPISQPAALTTAPVLTPTLPPPVPPKDSLTSLPGWKPEQPGRIYLSHSTLGVQETVPHTLSRTPQPLPKQTLPLAVGHDSSQDLNRRQNFSPPVQYSRSETRPLSATSCTPTFWTESNAIAAAPADGFRHHQACLSDPELARISLFATLREHWLPERLTRNVESINRVDKGGTDGGGGIRRGMDEEIYELSAVVFPEYPVELP